jgi:CrcB protein
MQTMILVAVAGTIGVLSRYAVVVLMKPQPDQFPLSTFIVNIAGCFIIGVIHVISTEKEILNSVQRTALIIGFLGGLTTFSSLALETIRLIELNQLRTGISYLVLSLILGIGATFSGLTIARKFISH